MEEYSILYRKCLRDGEYEYTVVDSKNESSVVKLEGCDGRQDPLKGLHKCEMKLCPSKKQITALNYRGNTVIKRL